MERNATWVAETLGVDDPVRLLDRQRANTGVTLLNTWVVFGGLLAALYSGLVTDFVVSLRATVDSFLIRGVVFLLAVSVGTRLVGLPLKAYRSLVVERKYGLNRQSSGSWVVSSAVGLGVSVVLTATVAAVVLSAIELFPDLWWIAAWLFATLFLLAMHVVYPLVIAPLFNEFTPIQDEDLRAAIVDLADRAGVSCSAVLVMDASKRSGRSNAYFVGLGSSKRVVIYDTLLEQLDRGELMSILAHEFAHWKKRHVYRKMAWTSVRIGLLTAGLYYFVTADWVYAMWALPREATYAGLLVGGLWTYPLARLSKPLENYWSIRHEREADRFAVELIGEAEPFLAALKQLTERNLKNPFPHPYFVFFYHDHPPIHDRLRHIERMAPESTG